MHMGPRVGRGAQLHSTDKWPINPEALHAVALMTTRMHNKAQQATSVAQSTKAHLRGAPPPPGHLGPASCTGRCGPANEGSFRGIISALLSSC